LNYYVKVNFIINFCFSKNISKTSVSSGSSGTSGFFQKNGQPEVPSSGSSEPRHPWQIKLTTKQIYLKAI
jgi:hypothetical protein